MTIISNPSSSHQQQQHRKLKQQNNHHHASPTTTSSTISRSTDSATTTPPTSQSTHSIQFPSIKSDPKLHPIQTIAIPKSAAAVSPTKPFPQLTQASKPILAAAALELSSTQPSQDSADMTPAQKIARQVRISFSISQPSSSSIPTPTLQEAPTSTTHQLESDPNLTQPPLSDALTPAQAVAQQARQMDSHTDLQSLNPASNTKETLPGLSAPQDPASFCVISGRKGLPGDGHDRMAVVRPPTEISLTPERPVEPKIVKRTSKLGMSSQVSSILPGPTDPTPSTSTAFQNSTAPLPLNLTNLPSSIPPTTSTILHHVSQAPPVATPSAPSIPLPIIPVAIFPTYSDEDDNNGSLEYSDGSPVVDSRELDPEEETDEEEDYDSNPLYIVLSTSLSPRLKSAYDSAKLVLLPTRRALPLDMPRKLPDPTLEFESEWEQWIAAHTFVSASDSTNVASGSDTIKDQAKEGVEWVGIPSMKDKRVNLYLKPGSGIAEVRLTYIKPPSSQITPNKSTAVCKSPESVAPTDFSPIRPNLEGDPHRTIRAKAGPDDTDYHYHSSTFGESLTSPPPTSDPPPGIPIERPQLTGSKTSPALTNIIRSPSTATESSLAFTQFSSGVSRACKSHLSNNSKAVETTLDDLTPVLPLGPALTAPLLKPIVLPSSTVTKIQTAKIISEETMYRSPSVVSTSISPKPATHGHETQSPRLTPFENGGGLESALSGSKAKKGKEVEQRLRFKAPKWLRPGAAQKEREKEKERREKAVAVATARLREERDRELSLMTRAGTKLERVRLISLKSPVIECWWQRSVEATDQDEEAEVQGAQVSQEPCEQCDLDHQPPSGGIFPFPRARTSTVTSCTEHRRMTHRSSISLSQRSTLSSTYPSQSMGRRSSSILTPEDDRSSRRSSTRQESTKRRSRRMPSGLSILKHSGTNKYRSVLGDFAFLLSPPEEFGAITCGILRKSVSKVWMHCHRFCETVVFLKGFESYILSQLKNEIYEPITNDIRGDLKKHGHATVESWGNEDWERLTNLVENVMFAFLHSSLYSRGLSCHYASEDDYLDSILHDYRKRQIPLREFEIELPAALQDESLLTDAVEKLNQLRAYEGAYSTPSPLSPEILQRLFIAMDTADEQTVLNILMAKTPVECISIIKQTIDILVSVWKDVSTQAGMDEEAQRLTPDDLLALLASVIVRSGIQQQHSLIQYVKVFRLTSSISPATDWAFVSYQAAIAYLQSDPFSSLDTQSIRSQPGSVRSMPPHSPSLASTWARRRPVSFTPPTTSSNAITISARSSPSGSRLSLTDHIQPRTAPPYTPAIYNNHRHTPRANLLMRSHNPTSSLALVDPPSVRLEVTSARHDHSRSVDCLHTHIATEAPHQYSSSRKLLLTPTILSPINTVDRSTLRIDTAKLSAPPMMDGGFGRSCSNPWDSSRSLSSIGEIVTDPSNNLGSTIKHSDNQQQQHHHHHPLNTSTTMRSNLSPHGIPIRNRSFHHPFSNGVDVQVVEGSSSPTGSEKNTSPVLSRRKTVDWAGTCVIKPVETEEISPRVDDETDRLRASQRSLSLLGGAGRPNNHHSRSGSLSTYSEFGNAKAERDSVASSDLRFRRTMTGSSLGHNSSSQELPSQYPHQHQQQTSEGWLEWGRKRLTSVTSLNMASSPNSDSVRTSARRGSVSSTCPSTSNMATRESFSLSTSSRSSELSSSLHHHHSHHHLQHHHRPTGPMTPAMEALSRARAASSLSIHRPPSSSPSSISIPYISRERDHNLSNHERVSSASSTTPSRSGDGNEGSQSTGMIPLRPILRPTSSASTSRLSLSVGPHSNSNSNSESPHSNHKENHNHNHLSLSLHHLSSHTSSTTSSSTTSPIDWNRSSSSLYTIH
ncbi:hypothetical protein Pst134EA_005380 [Puccinia striiformis f. sp. tritici]|nr:hypothetical protein Pst134EA_005380 [Puccinia striiformis f. sp. tritici]KAH9471484.1 hypothetical protein Pst134EA_005380 [Puccinia striiformis f. sp. tritici]